MWVQLSASPASPVSENGEAGEAATCTHIRPQILKVHMVRCQGTSPGHFGPLNREFHFWAILAKFVRGNPYENGQNMGTLFYVLKMCVG